MNPRPKAVGLGLYVRSLVFWSRPGNSHSPSPRRGGALRTRFPKASLLGFRPSLTDFGASLSRFATFDPHPTGAGEANVTAIKQPERKVRLQLSSPGVLNGTQDPMHATSAFQTPVEPKSPPYTFGAGRLRPERRGAPQGRPSRVLTSGPDRRHRGCRGRGHRRHHAGDRHQDDRRHRRRRNGLHADAPRSP